MKQENIRNFAVIAHIDHGKSTLADRLMEETGILAPAKTETPRIDRMELETERGVTIKLKAVRLPYTANGQSYVLNMLDTPGHVDFSYEVSRSLASCEGALLLVDATQGIQAQTLSHLEKARELGLTVIGVINKVDISHAQVAETESEMRELGITGEILKISALKGRGVREILQVVVERIPAPKGDSQKPFRALVFDSTFDSHLGALAYLRVVDGEVRAGEKIEFFGTEAQAPAKELGYFVPDRKPGEILTAGEVGYIATGLRDLGAVQTGDTVKILGNEVHPLPGYHPPQPYVFASFFAKNADFTEFKKALNTLTLEEPALSVEEISSVAFGRGFRLGFLGTFHLEIVKERLKREFALQLVVTKPTLDFADLSQEPWIALTVLTPSQFLSAVLKLLTDKRGVIGETVEFGQRLKLQTEMPLLEFVRGFYDALKSVSSGYASFSWEMVGSRPADLVPLEVTVHGESVEGLSEVVTREEAERLGRERLRKLKDVMPRQQFAYALQAKVGGKVVAREDVPAFRKDVLAKLSGGHVERKMKKLKEQKKGKARLKKFGKVEIPPEAYLT
ncbi:MAG: GTP-binding protein [Patescibacteria group bacterium]